MELDFDLGSLNDGLSALGRPALHFPEAHQAALDHYLSIHRDKVLYDLRSRFYKNFEQRNALDVYSEVRDLSNLVPDAAWLHGTVVPDDAQLEQVVATWLDTVAPVSKHVSQRTDLLPIDQMRSHNGALLDSRQSEIRRTVIAWATKSGTDIPAVWSEPGSLRDALTASGCLDFVPLDESGVLAWLASLGVWPTGMPVTCDLAQLGLTASDLLQESANDERSAIERRRAQRSVMFGDRSYDPASDQLADLMRDVDATVHERFLRTRSAPTPLIALPARPERTGGLSRPRPSQYKGTQTSPEYTNAIGQVGELLAYRWLQHAYPGLVTPDSWVSGNRTIVLGGHAGNDGLGYDFRLSRKSGAPYFEVKTTSREDYVFDISDRELSAASAARKGEYRLFSFVPCSTSKIGSCSSSRTRWKRAISFGRRTADYDLSSCRIGNRWREPSSLTCRGRPPNHCRLRAVFRCGTSTASRPSSLG